jgi:serine protease Do
VGIGFAIPSSIAVDVVNSLIKTGRVVRGWMGVVIQDVTPALAKSFKLSEQRKGVLISDMKENSPASAAGLKRGDIIIGFNEKEIQNVSQLKNMVAQTTVGSMAQVKVLRDGKEHTLTVKVAERPSDEQLLPAVPDESRPKAKPQSFKNLFDNMRVEDLTSDIRSKLNLPEKVAGVVVAEVKPGSNIVMAGVQGGDVIVEINHKPVKNFSEYSAIAKNVGEKETAVLLVFRQRGMHYIAVSP